MPCGPTCDRAAVNALAFDVAPACRYGRLAYRGAATIARVVPAGIRVAHMVRYYLSRFVTWHATEISEIIAMAYYG